MSKLRRRPIRSASLRLVGSNRAPNSLNHEDKPERTVLDWGDSKRAWNRWNNEDKPETTVLDWGDSKRAQNNLNNEEKPNENLTDNEDKDSDWFRLIRISTNCWLNSSIEFNQHALSASEVGNGHHHYTLPVLPLSYPTTNSHENYAIERNC